MSDELRPSEVNTASFSFRIPRELKKDAYDLARDKGRGWYVPTLTEVLKVLIAREKAAIEAKKGITKP